ncbi:Uncharacterized protein Rs2_35672 [Raphanus sativus]|nr:Uncharacterized protein Rs2_35672 [Raphanus sativus]
MKSRWWDPGIEFRDRIDRSEEEGAYYGGDFGRSVPNRSGLMGSRRKATFRICEILIFSGYRLLIGIIMRLSAGIRGINSGIPFFTKMVKGLVGFRNLGIWTICANCLGLRVGSWNIFSDYSDIGKDSIRFVYKGAIALRFYFISATQSFLVTHIHRKEVFHIG